MYPKHRLLEQITGESSHRVCTMLDVWDGNQTSEWQMRRSEILERKMVRKKMKKKEFLRNKILSREI